MGKGEDFERSVPKIISLWWTDNKQDDVFYRTHGSGSRATTRQKQGIATANAAGDLMSVDEVGHPFTDCFLIELKRGYTKGSSKISVLDLIDNKRKKQFALVDWYTKAKKEANFHKRPFVLIIFKRDYKEICVLLEESFLTVFEAYSGTYTKELIYFSAVGFDNTSAFYITTLDSFLKWLDKESIIIFLDENLQKRNWHVKGVVEP